MAKTKSSLPTAITYLVVGLALGITLIYSLFILLYSWLVEDNIFNRLVAAEAHYIQQAYQQSGRVEDPRSGFITMHPDWRDLPKKVINERAQKQDQIEFTLDDGSTVHIHVVELGDKDYVLMANVGEFEVSKDYLPNVITWLGLLALVAAALVSLIAFIVARRLTDPIKTLAEQVNMLPSNSVTAGFSQQYPNNEMRVLATTIESSFFNLQAALQREVNFTRDVSHEIRTPISILKNVLDANKTSHVLTDKSYQQAKRAILELQSITNTLLALSRDESTHTEILDMAQQIENILLHHFELNNTDKGQELCLQLALEERVYVETNQNLTQILLNNIVSNIVQYATGPGVEIKLTSTFVTFANQTTGDVPENPETAGVKGPKSAGIGQGMNLIERICQVNDWKMETSYTPPLFRLTIYFRD
jgi:hypothetical protein